MKAGWYILNYHDISYEDSVFTPTIGGAFRPDVFYNHLNKLWTLGEFITV